MEAPPLPPLPPPSSRRSRRLRTSRRAPCASAQQRGRASRWPPPCRPRTSPPSTTRRAPTASRCEVGSSAVEEVAEGDAVLVEAPADAAVPLQAGECRRECCCDGVGRRPSHASGRQLTPPLPSACLPAAGAGARRQVPRRLHPVPVRSPVPPEEGTQRADDLKRR